MRISLLSLKVRSCADGLAGYQGLTAVGGLESLAYGMGDLVTFDMCRVRRRLLALCIDSLQLGPSNVHVKVILHTWLVFDCVHCEQLDCIHSQLRTKT